MIDQALVKILLVEDNPADARLIREYYQRPGESWAELECAKTLSEALELLPVFRPDVVLLDLGLPDSQGLDGVRRILARVPLMPVLILTGLDNKELGIQAVAEGAQDYMLKGDVNASALKRAVRYAIERMRAWREAQESEARYHDLFEHAPDMLLSVDPHTGTILECNSTLANTVGCSKEELVGESLLTLFHPRSLEGARSALQEFQLKGRIVGVDLEMLTRSGDTVLVSLNVTAMRDEEGNILSSRFSLRDITRSKETELALAASTEQLRFRSRISDIFLATDDDAGFGEILNLVLGVTGSPHGLFGTLDQKGDLVVRAMSKLNSSDRRMQEQAVVLPRDRWQHSLLGRVMERGEIALSNDGPFKIPDGHIVLERVIATPILDQKRTVGPLAVANRERPFNDTDIETLEAIGAHLAPILASRIQRDLQAKKRRKAEAELRKLNQTLEERVAARTAEVNAANQELEGFAHSVSHDLRGPLRAIDGFSGILEEEYGQLLDEEGLRLLSIVRENTLRMGTLIDDLLEFSRVGRKGLRAQEVNMDALVKSVIQDLDANLWSGKGTIEVESLPATKGDASLLTQVWINLLSNAAKFSRTRESPLVRVAAKEEGGTVVYSVSDNGVGFDMAYADKLFGVFERLHHPDEFEGTGVGLALVSRIVQRHGGRIWGEGVVDGGATFRFTLSAMEGD